MTPDSLLAGALVFLPLLGVVAIGVPALAGRTPTEVAVDRMADAVGAGSLLAALALVARVLWLGPTVAELGRWYGDAEVALDLTASLDGASAAAATTIAVFGWLTLRFSSGYLHRESGHPRFFATTLLGMACLQVIALAASLDMLFIGWELLGLCSFLLIGFFHEREEAVERALRAIFNYRFADLGLLFGLILIHSNHLSSGIGPTAAPSALPTALGLLLLLTAAGKAGMAPFTGWLARCTEGPTSSTAFFYGGLSVCAGPWLLLRAWPLYADSPTARGALVAVGLFTALSSSISARTRSDVKGAIVLAGGAQLGLITAEIGLGLHTLAGLHLLGNLGLRTWQLLRSPSVLHLARERTRQSDQPLPAAQTVPMSLWILATAGGLEPVTLKVVAWLAAVARGLDRASRRIEAAVAGTGDRR